MTRSYAFVVPAWNEERCLPATLAAIRSAADGASLNYEIIVADDASSDRTGQLARDEQVSFANTYLGTALLRIAANRLYGVPPRSLRRST